MRTTTIQRLALAATLLLLVPLAAEAQPPGHFGPRHEGGHGPGPHGPGHALGGLGLVLPQLDLSADQEETIREIFVAQRETGAAVREGLQAARQAMREAARPDTLDEAAVRAAAAELANFEAEMVIQRARVLQQVRLVLTAEQRKRADELRERGLEMRERRLEMRERMGELFEERRDFWREQRREHRRERDSD